MSLPSIQLTIPSITSQIDCSIVGSYDFSITHQMWRPNQRTNEIPFQNKMFVLNSQFTNVRKKRLTRLMLHAIHLHSHWAVIIGSVEANKVWFDASSGFCLKRSEFPSYSHFNSTSLSFSGFSKAPKKITTVRLGTRTPSNVFDQIRTHTPKNWFKPLSIPMSFALWKVKTNKWMQTATAPTRASKETTKERKECGRYRAYAADSLAYFIGLVRII